MPHRFIYLFLKKLVSLVFYVPLNLTEQNTANNSSLPRMGTSSTPQPCINFRYISLAFIFHRGPQIQLIPTYINC